MQIFTRKSTFLLAFSLLTIAVGILLFNFQGRQFSTTEELSLITSRLKKEIHKVGKEVNPVLLFLNEHQETEFEKLNSFKTPYPYYVFKRGELSYWSSHEYVPKYIDVIGNYKSKYIETRKGKFIVLKRDSPKHEFEVFVLIPLHLNSLIENQYLFAQTNHAVFKSDDIQISRTSHDGMQQICMYKNECLFFVQLGNTYSTINKKDKSETLVIIALGILLLVFWVFNFSSKVSQKVRWKGVLTLIVLLVGIRMIMLQFDWQINAFGSSILNPQVFASSFITPTLADLFINMVLLLSVIVYVFFTLPKKYDFDIKYEVTISVLLGFISGTGLWQLYLLMETVYYNSKYTLDITSSVNFPIERVLVFTVLVMGGFVFILFYHIIYKLFQLFIKDVSSLKQNFLFLTGLVFFGFTIHFMGQSNWWKSVV